MMNRDFFQMRGFEGFKTIRELVEEKKLIPAQKGVYVVLRESESTPQFLLKGTGGHFKGKDPNVPISELKENWVEGTPIVYIGKSNGLCKRLSQYLRFGQGANVSHWGGRYIWQLVDYLDLVICWKTLEDDDPREMERLMIAEFKENHAGKRPFANLAD